MASLDLDEFDENQRMLEYPTPLIESVIAEERRLAHALRRRDPRAYEEVVVAVVANPDKSRGMFRPEERLRLVTEATAVLPNVRSVHFFGLTVDLARREAASVLVRVAHEEQGPEFSMAAMNEVMAEIPSVFLPAHHRTRTISSSLVRQLVDAGELTAAQELVPACVRQALADVTTVV